MGEHTHFTVVFERPEGYEDVHPQLCAEDHIIDYPGMKWEAADGNLIQQCDELAEALQQVSNQLKQAGASVPAPENKGTPESAIATGMSIALLLIEEAIAKHSQPQEEAPELFPGTLEALDGLGKQK